MDNICPVGFSYKKGEAYLDAISLQELAQTHGTPLYVMSKKTIVTACNHFLTPLNNFYPNSAVLYAAKANLTVGLAQLIDQEGLCFDVSSGGELFTVKEAGVASDKIYFHGNNKTIDELILAIKHKVTIIVDNLQELKNIAQCHQGQDVAIMIRLKPEIEAHTHEYIKTGQLDSKFGVSQDNFLEFIHIIKTDKHIKFKGIHSHIGSQIFDAKPYKELIDILVPFMKELKDVHGLSVEMLNCGGGMGINYTQEDQAFVLPAFIETFTKYLSEQCDTNKLNRPRLLFEPGRSIVGQAGLTLYTVGAVKVIPDIKTYAFIDGGMADNMRPIIYKSQYTFDKVSKTGALIKTYSIAGKFCESGDVLADNIDLEEVEKGDKLIVFSTGAYNYSMSSNYNRNTRPKMVLVDGDNVKTLVNRETYEDLTRFDCKL